MSKKDWTGTRVKIPQNPKLNSGMSSSLPGSSFSSGYQINYKRTNKRNFNQHSIDNSDSDLCVNMNRDFGREYDRHSWRASGCKDLENFENSSLNIGDDAEILSLRQQLKQLSREEALLKKTTEADDLKRQVAEKKRNISALKGYENIQSVPSYSTMSSNRCKRMKMTRQCSVSGESRPTVRTSPISFYGCTGQSRTTSDTRRCFPRFIQSCISNIDLRSVAIIIALALAGYHVLSNFSFYNQRNNTVVQEVSSRRENMARNAPVLTKGDLPSNTPRSKTISDVEGDDDSAAARAKNGLHKEKKLHQNTVASSWKQKAEYLERENRNLRKHKRLLELRLENNQALSQPCPQEVEPRDVEIIEPQEVEEYVHNDTQEVVAIRDDSITASQDIATVDPGSDSSEELYDSDKDREWKKRKHKKSSTDQSDESEFNEAFVESPTVSPRKVFEAEHQPEDDDATFSGHQTSILNIPLPSKADSNGEAASVTSGHATVLKRTKEQHKPAKMFKPGYKALGLFINEDKEDKWEEWFDCVVLANRMNGEVKRVLFCDGMRAILKKDRIKNVE